jgi:hypothetical protein
VSFLQQLLNQGLAGIDHTGIIAAVTTIGYTILLIGFMLALYQAAFRGGDVQALGVAAVKYVVVAIVLANWSTVFHDVNNAFAQMAQFIANSAGAGDVFSGWLAQLQQQFSTDAVGTFLKLIDGSFAAVIAVLMIVVAYVLFVVALLVLGFFYALYGCLLYVTGPLVLALLPVAGVGELASGFATNVFIWNSWVVLYAIFGALITAIHANDINAIFGSGFLGFFSGRADTLVLGIVSIFYAIALMLIPKIAKSVIAGDVGATMTAFVRAGSAAAKTALSIGSGAAGGGSGAASGAGLTGGGAASSASPPPQPSLAGSIRSGIQSAVGGAPPVSPSGNGSSGGGPPASPRSGTGSPAQGGSAFGGAGGGGQPFRGSPLQALAFHAARAASQAVYGATAGRNREKRESKE